MTEKFDFEKALKAIQSGQSITGKDGVLAPLVAYSGPNLPPIPFESCHPFRWKAATDSGRKLPPLNGYLAYRYKDGDAG